MKLGQIPGPLLDPGWEHYIVSNETKESIREKLVKARDTLEEVNDPAARAFVRTEIEELEQRLLSAMGGGPES